MGGGVSACRCRNATMKFAISKCALEDAKSKSGSWPSRLGIIMPRLRPLGNKLHSTISETNEHGKHFADADIYVLLHLRPFISNNLSSSVRAQLHLVTQNESKVTQQILCVFPCFACDVVSFTRFALPTIDLPGESDPRQASY
jgi:hypothetical protein